MFKVIVIGYSHMFCNLILGALDANSKVVGVLRHEKKQYNKFLLFFKDLLCPSKDYSFIKNLNLYELKCNSVNSKEFKKEVLKLNPDIIIIGSWDEKIKKEFIDLPKIGFFNCHPSLLPRYRGPNPYIQVIMNGEKTSGVTLHLLDQDFDTGAILAQTEIPINDNDTGGTLRLKTAHIAGRTFTKLLLQLNSEIIVPIPQNEKLASYQKAIDSKDIIIDFKNKTADEIHNHIRAITPFSKTYFPYRNIFFEVNKYKIFNRTLKLDLPSGTILKVKNNALYILTKDKKMIKFSKLKILSFLGDLKALFYLNFIIKKGQIIE